MKLLPEGQLLRIFIGESDKYKGKPLYEWLVIKAKGTNGVKSMVDPCC